jgi:hypothetical protein
MPKVPQTSRESYRESSLDLSPGQACVPKRLPKERLIQAAHRAIQINPANSTNLHRLAGVMPDFSVRDPLRIAAVVGRKWPASGVHLSVGFFGDPSREARARIISHLNAWSAYANVRFSAYSGRVQRAKVRIGFIDEGKDAGFWSWLGTEILEIPPDEPTMNLQGFDVERAMPESEYKRVIRHEAGHTLGFPHEHMRRELVAQIDEEKAIEYFGRTQGWTAQEVREQVLTPLEDSSLLKTPNPDPFSIMCYQIPGSITIDGEPILGGDDIDDQDGAFAAQLYPKRVRRLADEDDITAETDEQTVRVAQAGSAAGDDAAVIEIRPGITRIRVKRPAASAF